jgi:hypothetical protein
VGDWHRYLAVAERLREPIFDELRSVTSKRRAISRSETPAACIVAILVVPNRPIFVNSPRWGDDVKTIGERLGRDRAAFLPLPASYSQ